MSDSNLTQPNTSAYSKKRADRYSAGLCIVFSCSIPRGNGVRCPEHLRQAVDRNRERKQAPEARLKQRTAGRAQILQRIQRGMCHHCGCRPAPSEWAVCQVCRKQKRAKDRRRRERKRGAILGFLESSRPEWFNPNACAICKLPPDADRSLAIDHCHKTGMLRGLLCHHCNLGLGSFKDEVTRLRRAITYLETARLPTS